VCVFICFTDKKASLAQPPVDDDARGGSFSDRGIQGQRQQRGRAGNEMKTKNGGSVLEKLQRKGKRGKGGGDPCNMAWEDWSSSESGFDFRKVCCSVCCGVLVCVDVRVK